MKSDKMIQAAEVLDVLVKKLPDEVLREYFKVLPPKQVRKVLQQVIEPLVPQKDETPPPPSQATLWQSTRISNRFFRKPFRGSLTLPLLA